MEISFRSEWKTRLKAGTPTFIAETLMYPVLIDIVQDVCPHNPHTHHNKFTIHNSHKIFNLDRSDFKLSGWMQLNGLDILYLLLLFYFLEIRLTCIISWKNSPVSDRIWSCHSTPILYRDLDQIILFNLHLWIGLNRHCTQVGRS